MHYLSLLLLSLLLAFNTSAQKRFSQKDFNKLLPLTQEWHVKTTTEDHIFEYWEKVDDSTLQGNIYRSTDTGISPVVYVALKLRDYQIYFERTSLIEEPSTTHVLQLSSIIKKEFSFENSEKAMQINSGDEAAKTPRYQTYLFDSKTKIEASFQWSENEGVRTIRYIFFPAEK